MITVLLRQFRYLKIQHNFDASLSWYTALFQGFLIISIKFAYFLLIETGHVGVLYRNLGNAWNVWHQIWNLEIEDISMLVAIYKIIFHII